MRSAAKSSSPAPTATTQRIDLQGRTVIPGLNDSHIHVIRGGLNFNLELRWDGVPSLAIALRMLQEQARRTPPPQWVRVVGGWSEFQFAERRMPTLAEINAVSPDTPVFVLHLYDRAILNRAALRALGYNRETTEGGIVYELVQDANAQSTIRREKEDRKTLERVLHQIQRRAKLWRRRLNSKGSLTKLRSQPRLPKFSRIMKLFRQR